MTGLGQITVKVGQEVTPGDKLGRFSVKSGFRKINLAKLLSVSPQVTKQALQIKIGQRIFKGELLAFKKGSLFSQNKIITSPSDGVLDFFNEKTGEIRLELALKEVDLPSSVFGIVEKIDHAEGEVVIRTQATEIYGILGSGRVRGGQLRMIGPKSGLIVKNMINPVFVNDILVGGGLIYSDAIFEAVKIGVHGIITGGINAEDYKSMAGGSLVKQLGTDIGLSLLLTEGFGPIPIGEDIFETLKAFEGKFVIIDGNRSKLVLPSFDSNCMVKVRKTHLPDLKIDEGSADTQVGVLSLGARVRVIGSQFSGEQGQVVGIDQAVTVLPSKVTTYMVLVEGRVRKFKVPFTNLEIIG